MNKEHLYKTAAGRLEIIFIYPAKLMMCQFCNFDEDDWYYNDDDCDATIVVFVDLAWILIVVGNKITYFISSF